LLGRGDPNYELRGGGYGSGKAVVIMKFLKCAYINIFIKFVAVALIFVSCIAPQRGEVPFFITHIHMGDNPFLFWIAVIFDFTLGVFGLFLRISEKDFE